MGKHSTSNSSSSSKKKQSGGHDEDMMVFINMSQELKEEGNKLFQRRDYESTIFKYDKAIKLLPKNHLDVAHLRSNIATCFMLMNPPEYQRAIEQCNLALEVSQKYSKALLKRARCFEALGQLELAYRDVGMVLHFEPNNLTALEIFQRIKEILDKKGIKLHEVANGSSRDKTVVKEEKREKKKNQKNEKTLNKVVMDEQRYDDVKEDNKVVEEEQKCNGTKVDTKVVEEEQECNGMKVDTMVVKEELPSKNVKLVFGEDIRWAQLPGNCSLLQLRDVVKNRFPGLKSLLVKYKDKEGDLVTITTAEELRWAEESADPQGSLKLYIVDVDPVLDPYFNGCRTRSEQGMKKYQNGFVENGNTRYDEDKCTSTCVDDWIVQFAQLFKNHVGFNSDAYLDLHELSMRLHSDAMEDAVTCEEAQELFDIAANKFQEMAALALFNWGNVHMSRARKRIFLSDDMSQESVLDQVKDAYEWSQAEYMKAGRKYEEALKIKPDFFEALLAIGQQQFEQAKLSWYYAIGRKVDLDEWPSTEVLELLNNAEDNIERGTEMWEGMEEQRLMMLCKPSKEKMLLQNVGLDGLVKEASTDEAAEMATNLRAQINILLGTMLYERSVIEFKLGIPIWHDCLAAAIEKFRLAGASPPDIAVMIKNHCSNETAQEGLGFKIDEIVQAWNEMYDAKRWISGVPSFRLEPLIRRRVPKLHHMLEHM